MAGPSTSLRLVAPRDGWPQERAWRTASGADIILDEATVFLRTWQSAVADLHRVFATCPACGATSSNPSRLRAVRRRNGARPAARGLRVGLLFGPERAGLDNDDMAQADALIRYPLNPEFMSLNLVQAVMIAGLRVVDVRRRRPHLARS